MRRDLSRFVCQPGGFIPGAGAKSPMPVSRLPLPRQMEATDGQIDRLVYELYGLTEEEMGIVEGAVALRATPSCAKPSAGETEDGE